MLEVRNAKSDEFDEVGELMVNVYSNLDGFPNEQEQPEYYNLLLDVGSLTKKSNVELLVAILDDNKIVGAVVYFGDLTNYGSGGNITTIKNASGFRLLSVDPAERGKGIGKLLTMTCIEKAKLRNHKNILIHTTESMKIAWKMYERIGFSRFKQIDFTQGQLPVYGFKLRL